MGTFDKSEWQLITGTCFEKLGRRLFEHRELVENADVKLEHGILWAWDIGVTCDANTEVLDALAKAV